VTNQVAIINPPSESLTNTNPSMIPNSFQPSESMRPLSFIGNGNSGLQLSRLSLSDEDIESQKNEISSSSNYGYDTDLVESIPGFYRLLDLCKDDGSNGLGNEFLFLFLFLFYFIFDLIYN